MEPFVEAILDRTEGGARLRSPGVGHFTCALPRGRCLGPGEPAGVLITAGRAVEVRVPREAAGVVSNERPERVHRPVCWGDVLYELRPLDPSAAVAESAPAEATGGATGLALRSPQTGRFWRRSSPGAPPLASEGDVLEEGRAVGLIEVMKTFAQIAYRAGDGLPARARVARFLADDGDEVAEGAPLVELEEA